jgi:hypothetical protein
MVVGKTGWISGRNARSGFASQISFSAIAWRATMVATALLFLSSGLASADPCVVTDDGSGTVTLPPMGCDYLSPDEVHLIIDGLPAGTTIELAPIHKDFICFEQGTGGTCTLSLPPGECEAAGGALGGNGDCFSSTLEIQATGTGLLSGFNRVLSVQANTEIHTGPRTAGDPVQTFPTEMVALEGQLFGDPDFDTLVIRAGSAFGLPSPGSTTLTQLPSGDWNVDSFFDITYQIDFQGAPGSVLDGLSGTTQASITMGAGEPAPPDPCEVADNGSGTVTLPPAGCEYLSPDEVHLIIDGLPPGTTIELAPIHKDFICFAQGVPNSCSASLPPDECEQLGATGGTDCFQSVLAVELRGTGLLAGFQRTLSVPAETEIHTEPRTPGSIVQDFDTEMIALSAQLFGDPDFDTLQIAAGSDFGLPSPGHTTLTRLPNGNFNVDSFFDITYTIDFQGAPGSVLEGLGGSTTATIRMGTGVPAPSGDPCEVVDNGTGTVTLPPDGCDYLSPDEVHEIIDGLPAGTTIELAAIHKDFICRGDDPTGQGLCSVSLPPGVCETPGGTQGGNIDCFDSTAEVMLSGTGQLAGFFRNITLPVQTEVHSGPRTPGDAVQDFPTEMVQLRGEIFGDPDFDILRIEGGSGFGLPSPGQTTLTRVGPPGGNFIVDSFFDITYTIDFQGAPGSVLEGFAGTTAASVRMETGDPVPEPGRLLMLLIGVPTLWWMGRRRAR